MKGPMKIINASSGLMECRVCGSVHMASLQSGSERADGITRYYKGSYQCGDAGCPSNCKKWDENERRYVKPNWRKLMTDDSVNTEGEIDNGLAFGSSAPRI
jgi:hypothetical protein